jgi:hypothetical protein
MEATVTTPNNNDVENTTITLAQLGRLTVYQYDYTCEYRFDFFVHLPSFATTTPSQNNNP